MIDLEVVRLRKLRTSALRMRAIARALSQTRVGQGDPLLNQTACAAWRVARAVTGRLRAHPYESFQRDAGFGSVICNGIVAAGAVVSAWNRRRVFHDFSRELHRMSRELEDARALTWVPDLSDSFGRSLAEFRPLLVKVDKELRPIAKQHGAVGLQNAAQAAPYGATGGGDWPYLAL